MGGFVLDEGDDTTSVLTPRKFNDLLADQEIGFPLISEKEIQDWSKGDGLSKALVVVQTTWFIAQCISRKVQGLAITEIELVTVAFAFLNGIMYFLWWSKPVGVPSVRIYRLNTPIPQPPVINIVRDRDSVIPASTQIPASASRMPSSSSFESCASPGPIPASTQIPTSASRMLSTSSFKSCASLGPMQTLATHMGVHSVPFHITGSSGGLHSSLVQLCTYESCRSNIAGEFDANSPNDNSANGTSPTGI
jgi:hypothetical protein